MEQIHEYGKKNECGFATIQTMGFQGAIKFYEKLGYIKEFERTGYSNDSYCIFMRKIL